MCLSLLLFVTSEDFFGGVLGDVEVEGIHSSGRSHSQKDGGKCHGGNQGIIIGLRRKL